MIHADFSSNLLKQRNLSVFFSKIMIELVEEMLKMLFNSESLAMELYRLIGLGFTNY